MPQCFIMVLYFHGAGVAFRNGDGTLRSRAVARRGARHRSNQFKAALVTWAGWIAKNNEQGRIIMEPATRTVSVKTDDGKIIMMEASVRGEQKVSRLPEFPINSLTVAIEGLAGELAKTIDRVKPKKASIKFGVEVSVESGELTALIVKGGGKGNLEITLEWEREKTA
jgi:hypothetical protein